MIREVLREMSAEHLPELARIARGEVKVKLTHACEFCHKEPSEGATTLDDVLTQAVPPSDRRQAIDTMLKYGIGQLKEVSVENVRARVTETLRIIGLHCDPALAETLYSAIEPVWK